MEKIKPINFPAVSIVSDFHEIDIRTYLTDKNKAGVWFLNIEVEKNISALVARMLSGLPYEKASINRKIREWITNTYPRTNERDFSLVLLYNKREITYQVGA